MSVDAGGPPGRSGSLRDLSPLAAVVKPFRRVGLGLIVLGILAAATEGLSVGLMIPLLQILFDRTVGAGDGAGFAARALRHLTDGLGDGGRIAALCLLIVALSTLRSVVLYAYDAVSIDVGGRVTHGLRVALFRQLLGTSYGFFAAQDRGRLFDIVRGETWLVGEYILSASRALISLCAVLVFGALLVAIAAPLTLAAALAAALIALSVRLVADRTRRFGEEGVVAGAALSRATISALGHMRTIRLFGREEQVLAQFEAVSEWDRSAERRTARNSALVQPLSELLYAPLFIGVLVAAWVSGLEFPTLVAFLVLLYRLQPHARRLDALRVEMAGQLPALRQIADLLRRDDKPYPVEGQIPFEGLRDAVRFEAVSFAYDPGRGSEPAIRDLSFTLPRRRTTAIIGESGAGKSTVINLLFRLHDPSAGRILVDGTPLLDLDVARWRDRLAFAGQDVEIIGETVLEALRFRRPDASLAEVEEACRQANALDFIRGLPRGLETPVGEGGLTLSAGQRQRIGLARALLRGPDILVLDEATSALDPLSENLIQDALARLAGRVTMVIIAHRLATIREADQVIVLRQGRIVQTGTPQDLLRDKDGLFATLWTLQAAAATSLA